MGMNSNEITTIQAVSESLGDAFQAAYNGQGIDQKQTQELLESYKSVRRLLPHEDDGKRHGSYDAFRSTQG
jgi:hypothetical protein